MRDDKVHIVLASDANYRPGLEVTRASIERSCRSPERLVWHVFDETALDGLEGIETFENYHTSRMTYLRLWLPVLLPDVDRVIYSDVDTVWNRDICELWDEVEVKVKGEGEGKAIYWVKDFAEACVDARPWFDKAGVKVDPARYGCAGICVMNLAKMRSQGLHQRAIALVKRCGGCPPLADQDVLNALYNNDCALIPSCWNVIISHEPWNEPCVYHIIGIGRHFHDAVPCVYPPQYQLWWNVRLGTRNQERLGTRNQEIGNRSWKVSPRSRLLAVLWPLRIFVRLLPASRRNRMLRQLFFAKVLVSSPLTTSH